MMRTVLLLLLGDALLLLVAATLPAASDAEWTPVGDVHQPVIQQVGRFAVIVYGITHREKKLTYIDVVRGETEPAEGGGTNYRLVVTAAMSTAGGSSTQYECVVWGVPGSRSSMWKLRKFEMM